MILKIRLVVMVVLVTLILFAACSTESGIKETTNSPTSPQLPGQPTQQPSSNTDTAPISYAGLGAMFNTKTKQLVSEVDIFNDNNPTIILLVKLSDAPPSTRIRARWSFIKLEDKEAKDEVYVEHERVGEGNTDLFYYLYRPSQGWRKGDYKVVLLVGGEEKVTLSFKIE